MGYAMPLHSEDARPYCPGLGRVIYGHCLSSLAPKPSILAVWLRLSSKSVQVVDVTWPVQPLSRTSMLLGIDRK
ncbi:hypothetical protein PAXRUDRAFT_833579 [Paxillus rubicundulus Ve08.2h10]|uniref:Uncharacterized protein n=1 Tax=Paxillus rubicundulus Ve08.2h10 TaxID=930991 RepID=A0A0D0D973_9AGAM|nr:hypothetical protein PAXRUDRAFT_833579 [Paxillus rubicundulus Ve08.2h10]